MPPKANSQEDYILEKYNKEIIMNWTEISITTNQNGIEAITGALLNIGITGIRIECADDFNDFLEGTEVYWDYVDEELERLKEHIEKFYDDYIFYLSYWKSDAPYHGWLWSEDDGSMKNQAEITDGITHKFYEIYALILSGLGERCESSEI